MVGLRSHDVDLARDAGAVKPADDVLVLVITGSACARSGPLEAAQADRDELFHAADLRLEMTAAARRDLVGPATVVALERFDHRLGLQPADRAVERARAEPHARHRGDVFDHRVAVLWSAGKAGQYEKGGIVTERHVSPLAIS